MSSMEAPGWVGPTADSSQSEDWRTVSLGDVCSIVARQVDPKAEPYRDLPHVNGENIESGTGRLLHVKTAAEDGMTSGKYLFEPGDVLYSKLRPYLRKVVVVDFRGVCSADMYPIRVEPDWLDPEYAAWLLLSDEFTSYAVEESRRARMPKLNRDQLFSWRTALPPISEQRRIANRIKNLMSLVNRARAASSNRTRACQRLESSYLMSVFSGPQTGSWPVVPLGEAGEIVSGITLGRRANSEGTRRVPYLRVANVKDGHLALDDIYQIDATESEIAKLRLRYGDLLLTEGGDADKLGRGTFWEDQLPECIHQNHIFRVRFDLDHFCPRFLAAQIASHYGKSYFLAHAKQTTGIATINQRVLAAFPLMVPPLSVQRDVSSFLCEQEGHTSRLRQALNAEHAAIERLPSALLREAFSGAL